MNEALQAVRPPRKDELMRFYRNLGVMLSSGVSFARSFDTLSGSLTDPAMKLLCRDLSKALQSSGESLSAAMRRRASVFSPFHVGLIEAGEATGDVSKALIQLSDVEERGWRLHQKLRSALTYPVLILGLCSLIVFLFLPLYVFPQMLMVLESLHAPETGAVGAIMQAMRVTTSFGFLASICLATALFVYTVWNARRRDMWIRSILKAATWLPFLGTSLRMAIREARTEEALMAQWEALLLDVGGPFGRCLQLTWTARFSFALAAALESGLDVQRALDASARATGSRYLEYQLKDVRASLREGGTLHAALRGTAVFPEMFLQMMSIGEETGCVPQLCSRVGRIYEEELEHSLEVALAMLEPFCMLLLGGVVGVLVLVMLIPMSGALQQL